MIGGSEPAVVPVNYRLVDATISFRTTHEGRAGQPSPDPVLFEVDMFDERTHSGWSVIGAWPAAGVDPRHRVGGGRVLGAGSRPMDGRARR